MSSTPSSPSSPHLLVRAARGEAADYSMDYERGTITFTARRLISAASRIAVDYQVALTAYHRTLSALSGQARRGGLTAWGQFLKEGDAEDRPLAFSLDEFNPVDPDYPSEDIAGLGDSAVWQEQYHMLWVVTGGRNVTVQVSGVDLSDADERAKAIAVAETLV